jgi:rubrerythrin
MMSFVQRIHRLFTEKGINHSRERTEAPAQPDSQLYRCESCDTTYISGTMDTCPQCDTPVETTPTERELGYI